MGDKVNKKPKARFTPDKLPGVGYGFSADTVTHSSSPFSLPPPPSSLLQHSGQAGEKESSGVKYMR